MSFVEAYSTVTGRKQRVPEHFIGHPVLGRNLSLTPSAKAAASPVNSVEFGQADRAVTGDQTSDQTSDQVDEVELPEGDPTEEWTVAQLEQYATGHDIDLTGATRKADVLAAITTHLQDATDPGGANESPAAGEGQE